MPPAYLIALEVESGRMVVVSTAQNESEQVRLDDWVDGRPAWRAFLDAALELAGPAATSMGMAPA
jgi:hypothetical protein